MNADCARTRMACNGITLMLEDANEGMLLVLSLFINETFVGKAGKYTQ